MRINWSDSVQLMAEVITFLNEHEVDTSSLKGSMPDEYEKLADIFYYHDGETWSSRTQMWVGD